MQINRRRSYWARSHQSRQLQHNLPLALDRSETQSRSAANIDLRSNGFAQNGSIPSRFSEYADGVSPALIWSPVPNAQSYVLIMEDPDAKPITPFVHWLAWNIPGHVTQLPEGLQEQLRLTEPDGVLQGQTTRGSPGYYGPRPPVGDRDHRYHFQILALDTVLDLPAGADREKLLKAVEGHVIGKGNLVGTYRQTVQPLK